MNLKITLLPTISGCLLKTSVSNMKKEFVIAHYIGLSTGEEAYLNVMKLQVIAHYIGLSTKTKKNLVAFTIVIAHYIGLSTAQEIEQIYEEGDVIAHYIGLSTYTSGWTK